MNNKTKIFAAYLPQYHVTEDNNKFWGEGYTDWSAVKNAKPQYEGHKQPRVPQYGNYYDLSDVETIRGQAKLARKYSVDGFNIYHYWFKDGKQELEKPAEMLLENRDIDIEYFFTWDNAPWIRTWGNVLGNAWAPAFDSQDTEKKSSVLVEFEYGYEKEWTEHFEYLLPFFKDERYLKIDNKPVFMFVTHTNIELLSRMVEKWNELAMTNGFDGLYIATKKQNFGCKCFFDAVYKYEPETSAWGKRRAIDKRLAKVGFIKPKRDGAVKYLYEYETVWKRIIKTAKNSRKTEVLGAFVQYDDTPRRGSEASVIIGETPELFGHFFEELYRIAIHRSKPFILLTAWNEWGEGAYLEPDDIEGEKYLAEIKRISDKFNAEDK